MDQLYLSGCDFVSSWAKKWRQDCEKESEASEAKWKYLI